MSINRASHSDRQTHEDGDPIELRFDERESTSLYGTEVRRAYPPSRAHQLGLTGAAINDGDLTADDAAPETLLDLHPSHSPNEEDTRTAVDSLLSVVDADDIGVGHGQDQAEPDRHDSFEDASPQRGRRKDHAD